MFNNINLEKIRDTFEVVTLCVIFIVTTTSIMG